MFRLRLTPRLRPLSYAQKRMLRGVANGCPSEGLTTAAEAGGAAGTWTSLHRRGLLNDGALTDDGYLALIAAISDARRRDAAHAAWAADARDLVRDLATRF